MFKQVREELIKISETKLKEFNEKLCPNNENKILGIRIPTLRKIAKEIVKSDWQRYLKESQEHSKEQYMEERMVEGLVIAYSKISLDEKLELIEKFIPKINNWAINDTFCSTIKIKKKELERIWQFILPYLKSGNEFEVRFAVIMMLHNFIIDDYVEKVIKELDKVSNNGYYAKMAVAWTLAEIGIKYNDKLMKYLNGKNNLDNFTFNKTLQKMIESYRISIEQKEVLKKMKKV